MNYSILLVVEKPDLLIHEVERKWDVYKTNMTNISTKYTDMKMLGENVLLISLQNSLTALNESVNCLDGMDYKYALFDTEIQWHEAIKDFKASRRPYQ